MMIAPILHPRVGATTSPPEALRPVLEKLQLIATVFFFKFALEVLRFLLEAIAPTRLILGARPSNELQITFVFVAILALAVLVVPLSASTAHVSARFLVRRPVRRLTRRAFIIKADDHHHLIDNGMGDHGRTAIRTCLAARTLQDARVLVPSLLTDSANGV